jgi:hypothetical protein
MPYKSKAQMRLFFAKEKRGELPKGTAERWAEHTPSIKALPEHKKEAFWLEALIPAFTKLAEALHHVRPTPAAITLKQAVDAERQRKQKGMNVVQYRNYLTSKKRNVVARGSASKKVT